MQVFSSASSLNTEIKKLKKLGKTIGFVPTMGALHDGHLSLVKRSKEETDITVVSIFVNPIQFNDKKDLENYPRLIEHDTSMLRNSGADFLFYPTEHEMYPEPVTEQWDFGQLDKVMEGAHRPGHFNGVAIVVKRLFEIVEPHKAYFGQKDFQQLAIIRQLVKQTQLPVEIIPCAIVRETDGLAMSSRNMLLSPTERAAATIISRALFQAREQVQTLPVNQVIANAISTIESNTLFAVEYFQIVDVDTLQPVDSWEHPSAKVACVAARIGKVRLIDNIIMGE